MVPILATRSSILLHGEQYSPAAARRAFFGRARPSLAEAAAARLCGAAALEDQPQTGARRGRADRAAASRDADAVVERAGGRDAGGRHRLMSEPTTGPTRADLGIALLI